MIKYMVVETFYDIHGSPEPEVERHGFTDIIKAEEARSVYLRENPEADPDNVSVIQYIA